MKCGEFETRLNDWLDVPHRELDYAAAAHARQCPQCGELLAAHELLFAGLSDLPQPQPSRGFSFRVLEELTARPRWSTPSRIAWALPLAAAAAISMVTVALQWFGGGVPGANQMTANPANANAGQDGATAGRDTVASGPAYFDLLRQTGFTAWPSADAASGFAPPSWVSRMTDGLRPVPTSMGAVLIAQPFTSPMGAALLALNGTVPGA